MSPPLQLTSSSPGRCYELTAFAGAVSFGEGWPTQPGMVRRGADDRAELLHFAPGRWLVPAPDPALLATLDGVGSDAALVDVTGKWHVLHLPAPHAERLLRSQLAVGRLLGARACAATSLFDCPCVLVRIRDSYDVWTHASYERSVREALERAYRDFGID